MSKSSTIKALFDELTQASHAFHNGLSRTMTDKEFDEKVKEYEELSGKPFTIGAKVDESVDNVLNISHEYENLAGTLAKAQNQDDFHQWYETIKNKTLLIGASIKADGHSVTIEAEYDSFKNKMKIVKALTRGEEGVGKDLTKLFQKHSSKFLLHNFNSKAYGISYEAVMTYENFEKCIKDHGLSYNNPRSIINAVFSEKGKHLFEYMTFIPLKIKGVDNDIEKLEATSIFNDYIHRELGYFPYFDVIDIDEESLVDDHLDFENLLWNKFENIQNQRSADMLPIMADGVVFEILDHDERNAMGYLNNRPRYAIAVKFEPEEKETELLDVTFSSEGSSGRYTPMAHFKPIRIDNNEYSKVSLANYARFESMDLHKGDKLIFTRRNDVLGYVEKVEGQTSTGEKFYAPKVCEECDHDLVINGAFLDCENPNCSLNAIGTIMNGLRAFDMKSIGRETVEKLYDSNLINNFVDLVYLAKDYPINMENNPVLKVKGLGKTVLELASKLYSVIENKTMDYQILDAMNIPMIGTSRSKSICNHVHFSKITEMTESDWKKAKIPDLGDKLIKNIIDFMKSPGIDIFFDIANLAEEKMTITFVSAKDRKESMTFVHTGSASPLAKRKDLVSLIESRGHKMSGSVSAKTSYLVCNDVGSGSGKVKDAEKHGVKVISVQELIDLLG
ncbi:BRCT domain-containing protein [Proteus mirabilis]|uniref:BRCT domain-containing protein n=1 Tax=Proteus mirabilis TaxID=584 RepID=UPI0034D706C9